MSKKLSQVVPLLLAAWFALVVVAGTAGAFVSSPGRPPLPIAL